MTFAWNAAPDLAALSSGITALADASVAAEKALDDAEDSSTYLRPPGNGFVALGDSISTAYLMAAGGAGFGCAWAHMVCALSNQRLNYLGNAGVAGQVSAQILTRVPDVIALNPQIVTVLAGANDLTGGVTFATWSANIKAIATQLRAAGIRAVLCTIPPRENTTYFAANLTWNRWLKAYAQANRFDLLDFFALLVNPATGIWKAGYDSGFTPHPSQAAHIAMATYAAAQITTGPFTPICADTAVDAGNLISNPLLTTGSPTPDLWIKDGAASADYTEALVTDADFKGKAWQIAYTNAASEGNYRTFSSWGVSAGFSPGDVLAICVRTKVTVATNIVPSGTAGLRIQITADWSTPVAAEGVVHAAGLHWFRYVVPPATTIFQVTAIVGLIPVGASFTVLVGEFGMFNLTTGQLLTP